MFICVLVLISLPRRDDSGMDEAAYHGFSVIVSSLHCRAHIPVSVVAVGYAVQVPIINVIMCPISSLSNSHIGLVLLIS